MSLGVALGGIPDDKRGEDGNGVTTCEGNCSDYSRNAGAFFGGG